MKLPLIFLVAYLLCPTSSRGQDQSVPKVSVKGIVVDDSTGAPLPLANIFVAGTTIGTAAKPDGTFLLRGVPVGVQQIVASIVGYQPASKSLRLADSTVQEIQLRLRSRPVQMSTIEIEARDPVEWRKYLERFLLQFFGTTPNAGECRLQNPEVIDFSYDEGSDRLTATARSPLEIENRALGYHVQCILLIFLHSPDTFQYTGMTAFRPLKPADTMEANLWKANRRESYLGSKRHFLHSLVKKNTKAEGFAVNMLKTEWIEKSVARPFGFEMNPDELLEPGDVPYERIMSIQVPIQIIYTHNGVRRISVIDLHGPTLTVFTNGLTANPLGLWTFGYWSTQRGAEMLPADYEPE